MGLCPECLQKRAEKSARPSIVASGGFCFPTENWFDLETCFLYSRPKFKNWFDLRMLKQPVAYWKAWRQMGEDEGKMIHGYYEITLPVIQASRGGFNFEGSEEDAGSS